MLDVLDHTGLYIIGVSGGSDSMALLSMCVNEGIGVVVAHVNYQKRDSADRDQAIVEAFCHQHKLPLHVRKPHMEGKQNFQGWAREARYAFFSELYQRYHARGLLTAHHEDDAIETYLMQKRRGSRVSCYGIPFYSRYQGMEVYRPLLDWRKEQLLAYVIEHHIPYGFDESNASDVYTRNRVRHTLVEPSDDNQRREWLAEMKRLNHLQQERTAQIKTILAGWGACWKQDEYAWIAEDLVLDALRAHLLHLGIEQAHRYSERFLRELDGACRNHHAVRIALNDTWVLDQSYGQIFVHTKAIPYCYHIDSLQQLQTPYFHTSLTNGRPTEAVSVTLDDFPLCIRSAQAGDAIRMRFGTKAVSRWFIDRKIPMWQREVWPIVCNRHQEIILVPQIGCNVTHYHTKPNLFVIK